MFELSFVFLFFAIPAVFVVFFIVSLALYLSAKKKNRLEADDVSEKKLKTAKICLIVSAVIAGVLVAVHLSLFALLAVAIAYM